MDGLDGINWYIIGGHIFTDMQMMSKTTDME